MMRNESEPMKEIHAIREQIYEETKDMTPQQRAEHTRRAAEELATKHGISLLRPNDARTQKVI